MESSYCGLGLDVTLGFPKPQIRNFVFWVWVQRLDKNESMTNLVVCIPRHAMFHRSQVN